MAELKIGQKAVYERTFTLKDVEAFAALTGDRGKHHIQPDKEGRVMVHGLITLSVQTKLAGDISYIARDMTVEFVRPVFAGDTVRAESTITRVERGEGRLNVAIDSVCFNQRGKEVLRSKTSGIVRL